MSNNSRTKNPVRRIVYYILMIVFVVAAAGVMIYSLRSSSSLDGIMLPTKDGEFNLADYNGTDSLYVQNGWEYYPGQWIVSDAANASQEALQIPAGYVDLSDGTARASRNLSDSSAPAGGSSVVSLGANDAAGNFEGDSRAAGTPDGGSADDVPMYVVPEISLEDEGQLSNAPNSSVADGNQLPAVPDGASMGDTGLQTEMTAGPTGGQHGEFQEEERFESIQRWEAKASYRAQIRNISQDLGLYISGDHNYYRIFINGEEWENPSRNLLFSDQVVQLEAGEDYEIVIEDTGYLPREDVRVQITSFDRFQARMNLATICVLLAIGIGVFFIASGCILLILSPGNERRQQLCVLVMALLALVWFICVSTKYVNTLRVIAPSISDMLIVNLINILMPLCLIIDFYCILYYVLKEQPTRRMLITMALAAAFVILYATGGRGLPNLIQHVNSIVSIAAGILAIVIIFFRLHRRNTDDYFWLLAFALLPVCFAAAMAFPSSVMNMTYILILTLLLVAVLFLMILSVLLQHFHLRRELEQTSQAKEKLLQMQGAFWASQIQPHFIYNTLQNIQGLCVVDPEGASELVGRFSDHLRRNVDYINMTRLISFRDELAHVDNYVNIQKVRFGASLQYIQHIEVEDFQIPPLTVQPLVENAIRYGVRNSEDGGTVTLTTKRMADGVHILIEDDGPGFDYSKIKSNGGIANVSSRLQAFANAQLHYRRTPEGRTIAEIHIREDAAAQ